MIKWVALLKRRDDMRFEDFVDYYENHHALLAPAILQNLVRYERHYLTPCGDVVEGNSIGEVYDCITELWFENQEEFDKALACLAEPLNAAAFAEDQTRLFDCRKTKLYVVAAEKRSV
jgi:ABC-type iron transport system FetAB permease component